MAGAKTVAVPDIGDFKDVPVIEILVAVGEQVEADQPLIVLESDKSTMEVPAPEAGTIESLALKVGDTVTEGDTICTLAPAEAAPEAAPAEAAAEPEAQPQPEPEPAAEPAPAPAAAGDEGAQASETVAVPDIGDFTDVPVIEVLVAAGDTVEADQPLIVLESDKSAMEVPSPRAGTVASLAVKVGDTVSEGDAICVLEGAGGQAAAPAPAAAQEAAPQPASAEPKPEPASEESPAEAAAPDSQGQGPRMQPQGDSALLPHASPAVRRFARELGVDLQQVSGSGAKGRILREDVQHFVKGRLSEAPAAAPAAAAGGGGGLPTQPEVDFTRFGAVEKRDLARIRRISANNLHRNWLLIPHVTQTDQADITDLEAFRKQESTAEQKLTLLPFMIKAVASALRQFPEFNSSLSADGQQLILKQYCHIGFAADTPNGLLVPVVRDVWDKSVRSLGAECAELAAKARDGKLKPDEMQGGCFSISSLGGIGGSHFTPIINAPEVAILGVSKASTQPVWDGAQFQPRLMCPLSLSYDHRVIDGAAAARFIVHLKGLLEDMRRALL